MRRRAGLIDQFIGCEELSASSAIADKQFSKDELMPDYLIALQQSIHL